MRAKCPWGADVTNRLLQTLAVDYCCVAKFIEDNVLEETKDDAADRLGVTSRTIQNYRSRFRTGDVYFCPACYQRRRQEAGKAFPALPG